MIVGLGVAVAALAWSGCGPEKTITPTPVVTATPKTVSDFFSIKVGDKTVRMQLAVRMPEMQRGLMERRDLGRDEGMIFIYEKPQQMSFWMHNTPTPLDIGFFNPNGDLLEVYGMQPFDETTVPSRSSNVQLALEMNIGWYAQNGVRPGAKIDLKALGDALKQRGFEPSTYHFGDGK